MQQVVVLGSSGGCTVAPTFQPGRAPSSWPSAIAFTKSSFGTEFAAHLSVNAPEGSAGETPTWM